MPFLILLASSSTPSRSVILTPSGRFAASSSIEPVVLTVNGPIRSPALPDSSVGLTSSAGVGWSPMPTLASPVR